MSTRGIYGLRKNGADKVAYNHSDSYPAELGLAIVMHIQNTPYEKLSEQFDFLQLIDEDTDPTSKQIALVEKIKGSIAKKENDIWYSILRDMQGDLSQQMPETGLPFFLDYHDFLSNSLHCEWAYIINLDTMNLEVYKGLNKNKNAAGRYAACAEDEYGYCGVSLIAEIPFETIRENGEDYMKSQPWFE